MGETWSTKDIEIGELYVDPVRRLYFFDDPVNIGWHEKPFYYSEEVENYIDPVHLNGLIKGGVAKAYPTEVQRLYTNFITVFEEIIGKQDSSTFISDMRSAFFGKYFNTIERNKNDTGRLNTILAGLEEFKGADQLFIAEIPSFFTNLEPVDKKAFIETLLGISLTYHKILEDGTFTGLKSKVVPKAGLTEDKVRSIVQTISTIIVMDEEELLYLQEPGLKEKWELPPIAMETIDSLRVEYNLLLPNLPKLLSE